MQAALKILRASSFAYPGLPAWQATADTASMTHVHPKAAFGHAFATGLVNIRYIQFLKHYNKEQFMEYAEIILSLLSSSGTFLGGLAALLAIVWAFPSYLQKRRSEAAASSLSAILRCIKYYREIIAAPYIYMCPGYSPGSMPETLKGDDEQPNKDADKVRPNRLLSMKIDSCYNNLLDLLPKLGESKAYELLKLLEKVKATSGGYVQWYSRFGHFPTEEEYKHPSNEIDLLEQAAQKILQPIIDGKKKTNK